jgi:spore maturation protein CgeB
MEMYRTVATSLVTFNVHVDAAGDYVGNIRMYEATGVGTCMLTDWKKDLSEFFEIDKEVVSYSSADEAVEKARWLAQHPEECLAIGRAAQRRVLRDHTYRQRAALMHEIFMEQL